jgi:hypothetical protein
MSALVVMLVLVADRARGLQLAVEYLLTAASAEPDAPTMTSMPFSLKMSMAPPPMPPDMITLTPLSFKKFGRKPDGVRVVDKLAFHDLSVFRVVNVETLAVSEVFRNHFSFACNRNFHNNLQYCFPFIYISCTVFS